MKFTKPSLRIHFQPDSSWPLWKCLDHAWKGDTRLITQTKDHLKNITLVPQLLNTGSASSKNAPQVYICSIAKKTGFLQALLRAGLQRGQAGCQTLLLKALEASTTVQAVCGWGLAYCGCWHWGRPEDPGEGCENNWSWVDMICLLFKPMLKPEWSHL